MSGPSVCRSSASLSTSLIHFMMIYMSALYHGLASPASAQEMSPTVSLSPIRALSAITFSEGAHSGGSGDEQSLGVFALLRLQGSEAWDQAQVEFKYELADIQKEQMKSLREAQAVSDKRSPIQLPAIKYSDIGRLQSADSMITPHWVIWLPHDALSSDQAKTLEDALKVLAQREQPSSQLSIYQGETIPKLIAYYSQLAKLEINSVNRWLTRRDRLDVQGDLQRILGDERSSARHGPRGLFELLSAIRIQHMSDDQRMRVGASRELITGGGTSSYQCGRACDEVIPHTRILVVRDRDSATFTEPFPSSLRARFSALKYSQQRIFRPHVFILDPPSDPQADGLTSPLETPVWLAELTHDQSGSGLNTRRGQLAELDLDLIALRQSMRQTYYVTPPITVPPYFWALKHAQGSLRLTQGDETFVLEVQVPIHSSSSNQEQDNRRRAAGEYQDKLRAMSERSQDGVLSWFIWITLSFLAALGFGLIGVLIILHLRRNHHLSSDPKFTAIDTDLPTSPTPTPTDPQPNHHSPPSHEPQRRPPKPIHNSSLPSTAPARPENAIPMSNRPQAKSHPSYDRIEASDLLIAALEVTADRVEPVPPLDDSPSTARGQDSQDAQSDHSTNSKLGTTSRVQIMTPPLAGLYAASGPMEHLYFLIFESPCIVGRDPELHCALPPSGEKSDIKISRRHLSLTRLDDHKWELQCLSSQNLEVDQYVLRAGDCVKIQDGVEIKLGLSVLVFRASAEWRESFSTSTR